MSGKNCFEILEKIFKPKKQESIEEIKGYTMKYGHIIENEKIIDEVLVSYFKEPMSYTTENMCEINSHGGNVVMKKILELCLENGAQLAEPGEFTKRAFLNGRIDLTQAESVIDVINAKSEKEVQAGIKQLEGGLSKEISAIKQEILDVMVNIEVAIDYPEYDVEEVTNNEIMNMLDSVEIKLNKLEKSFDNGKILKEGIKTAIIGKPNAGKSSLLNRILKEDRAIVTEFEGTTRDIVEGSIIFDGIELSLIDTAGIRDTDNLAEKIGVEKSLSLINKANLIIVVLNSSEELNDNDKFILDKVKDKNPIIVLNKNDLPKKIDTDKLDFKHIVSTNTNTLDGIESLKEEIKSMFKLSEIKEDDYTSLANERQLSLAKKALKSLGDAKISLENNEPVDIIEIDLKEVLDILGSITGESYSDELLDELFANFCVGK